MTNKADYEVWVTRKGQRHGRPYAERRTLAVPWELARGHYEQLSALQLREALHDLQAESDRRGLPATQRRCDYDPLASQIRRPSKEQP